MLLLLRPILSWLSCRWSVWWCMPYVAATRIRLYSGWWFVWVLAPSSGPRQGLISLIVSRAGPSRGRWLSALGWWVSGYCWGIINLLLITGHGSVVRRTIISHFR